MDYLWDECSRGPRRSGWCVLFSYSDERRQNVCIQDLLLVLSLLSHRSLLLRSARLRGVEVVIAPSTLKRTPLRQN